MSRRTANEDRIIGTLDRERSEDVASVRTLQIREMAKATIICAAKEYDGRDRLTFLKAGAHALRDLFVAQQDEAGAVSFFGSLAYSPTLTVNRAIAAANAEKVFAANDGSRE